MPNGTNRNSKSYYSYSSKRSLRDEEVAAYKRIALATVIIVSLLVGGYFLGIPLLARLGSGSSAKVDPVVSTNTIDKIPPSSPRLDGLPDAVKTKTLTVTGSAEDGTTVAISVNDTVATTTLAGKDGTFSAQVTLKGGSNTLSLIATDTSKNTSKPSPTITIVYDAKPPSLSVSNPSDADTTVSSSTITVTGKTETDATVTINDRQAIVLDSGEFSTSVQLSQGSNSLIISATDKAGNTSKIVRTVTSTATQASASASQ